MSETQRRERLIPVVAAGVRAAYTDKGGGPPLLLIPSSLVLERTYRRLSNRLARRFRVITPEAPGSGVSDRLAEPWDVPRRAAWLTAFLERLAVRPAVVVGHSFGALVAVTLAADRPDLVGRLVIVDPSGFGGPYPFWRIFLAGCVDAALELPLVASAWHHFAYNVVAHRRNQFRTVRLAIAADGVAAARRVRCPVLVGWGARDHLFPPAAMAHALRAMPHARVHLSRRGSHDWCISRHWEFAAAVEAFAGDTSGDDPLQHGGVDRLEEVVVEAGRA